ncbi:IPT/TIG domain-containing protein [Flavobacterium beibuense]|uniref:IPT/TIG domain-containing protein n=1 Tax=Flavobacterium beibuense TaxID=657326 RepID=UPI00068CF4BA|nr:IPT/TIG domain-containing protein [Flavobacterium beibuense]
MKNFRLKHILGLLSVFAILFVVSCSDDDSIKPGKPSIESVSYAENDSLVEYGYANNMYIVRGTGFTGTEKIYFNDVDTYFNPTLVTDGVIFVTIDEDTPYENASNELKVVTPRGTAIYPFVVAPPAPTLKSFQPINAAEGEEITIYGKYFLDPVVTIDGVEAEIVSSSIDKIVAIVPAGSNGKYVQVETISGASKWDTAIGTAIYDDAFYAPWDIEAWNNHEYITNEADAYQGTTFIKKEIAGWDNIQGNWNWDDQISQYTGIHFAVRSDDAGKLVLIFNGANWGDANFAFETTEEWIDFRFTWEELGGMPEALQNISFQEFTGETHNYYFDNFGYTVD